MTTTKRHNYENRKDSSTSSRCCAVRRILANPEDQFLDKLKVEVSHSRAEGIKAMIASGEVDVPDEFYIVEIC